MTETGRHDGDRGGVMWAGVDWGGVTGVLWGWVWMFGPKWRNGRRGGLKNRWELYPV